MQNMHQKNKIMEIEIGKELSKNLIGIRDALHIPVICVKAHTELSAGEWVGIKGDYTCRENEVGIVDPFYKGLYFEQGEVCAVLLLPKSTTNVRHSWDHPEIDNEVDLEIENCEFDDSKSFLQETAKKLRCSVYTLEDAIHHMIEYGSSVGGPQPNLDTTDNVDWEKFWKTYNILHGTSYKFSDDPFCC
jgi:hypothetical protein